MRRGSGAIGRPRSLRSRAAAPEACRRGNFGQPRDNGDGDTRAKNEKPGRSRKGLLPGFPDQTGL